MGVSDIFGSMLLIQGQLPPVPVVAPNMLLLIPTLPIKAEQLGVVLLRCSCEAYVRCRLRLSMPAANVQRTVHGRGCVWGAPPVVSSLQLRSYISTNSSLSQSSLSIERACAALCWTGVSLFHVMRSTATFPSLSHVSCTHGADAPTSRWCRKTQNDTPVTQKYQGLQEEPIRRM